MAMVSADLWHGASGGMVASAAFHAETSAVRRGLLASRLVSAGLRAEGRALDEVDVQTLQVLLAALGPDQVSDDAAVSDDVHAFAEATHAARPSARRGRLAAALVDDLTSVREDAELLLAAARATGRRREALYGSDDVRAAAARLVQRFAAVSQHAMSEAGSPGDSVGGLRP